jgi:hypothetical protein
LSLPFLHPYALCSSLGVPTPDTWPGVWDKAAYPHFNRAVFPRFPGYPWARIVPGLADDPLGLDLLAVSGKTQAEAGQW